MTQLTRSLPFPRNTRIALCGGRTAMPFGEIVIGSPGSGKSTYAYGKYQVSSCGTLGETGP